MQNDDDTKIAGTAAQKGQEATWRALFSFTHKTHLLALVPGLLLALGAGILEPAMAIFLGKFFDAFADFGAGRISSENLMDRTMISVYALLGVGSGTLILKGGLFCAWMIFGEMQAKAVRDELFQGLLEKDLEWYEKRTNGVGTLLTRLQTQIRELQIGTSQPMGFAVTSLVEGFAALGLSLYYNWKLTLVTLASVPISALILHLISRGIQQNVVLQGEALSEASNVANSTITHIALVKSFNTQEDVGRQYSKEVQNAAKYYLKQARSNALQMGFVRFASTTMFVQGFWYGGTLVHEGKTTAGKVITTFWACLMAVQAFQDILPFMILLEKGRAAAVALKSLVNVVKRGTKFVRKTDGIAPQFCEGDIELRDVSFAYPARPDHPVLHQSTFFFPAGEMTFIVGRSGSGKSTLGSLLMRFYRPTAGYVCIDGNVVDDLDTHWLRNNITLVQQQSILFNESLLKNIAFGHQTHDRVTHFQVKPCLELAALQETVAELPDGVETKVGTGGSALSGGQKQRIAIARARLRDTPVLILDESTSALDHVSRTAVMKAVRQWRNNRTTIIITHDMNQINDDDFVYVLEEGHIIAEGYRHNVSKELDKGSVDSPVNSPTISKSFHFDFDVTKLAARASVVSRHPRLVRTQRDSLEIQLRAVNEDQDTSLIKTPRFSRYFGNQLSLAAGAAIDNLNRLPKLQTQPVHRSDLPNVNQVAVEDIHLSRRMTARPMSMHQAIFMKSITADRQMQKTLPTPQIVDTPGMLRRLSRYRKPTEFDAVPPPKQLSVQKILQTVWPGLDKKGCIKLLLGFVAVSAHAGVPPAFSYILVQLFQTFYLRTGYKTQALRYSLAILGIAAVDGLATYFMRFLLESAGQAWVDQLRVEALKRIIEQAKEWFDNDVNTPAYLTSALDRNAEEMRNLLGRFAALVFVVVVMMIISIIWALVTCWKITMVALSAVPVIYMLTRGFDMVSSRWESRTNTAGDIVGAIFVETFSDIRTVRALTLESYFHRKYTLATSSAFSIGIRRAAYSGLFFGLSDSAVNYISALIFWFGAYLAKTHTYSTKAVLEALSLILFSTAAANGIIAYMPQLASSVDTASRLLRLSQLPLRSHEYSGRFRLLVDDPATLSGPISFINLTFYYPSRPTVPALRCLNLTIPSGCCTAIVGASGSGKSTIASLLLGLYPPMADEAFHTPSDSSSGPASLTLSGRDIRSLHLPTLRSLIAIVPQTPIIFPTTVLENIIYGLALSSPLTTTANIEQAAKRAGIHEFITSLPCGYQTVLAGSEGSGPGLGVSGGQAQRIVIARALVRRPRILILDEATSALDGESARLVRKSVLELLYLNNNKQRETIKMTVLIITHAKEMMACADNVVVLDGGRLVEEGGYRELLARKGKLWEMLQT